MSHKQYDLAVFIGRFSPFHKGHEAVISQAFDHADHVLVLIGSANRPQTLRNPFSYQCRVDMIDSVFPCNRPPPYKLTIRPLNDFGYRDQRWMEKVQSQVGKVIGEIGAQAPVKIALIGLSKDETSYYLFMFPQWGSINVNPVLDSAGDIINASDIRTRILDQFRGAEISHIAAEFANVMSKSVSAFLGPMNSENLMAEYKCMTAYRRKWEHTPYPVTFQTVDAIIIQSGHILIVERGSHPGKDLLALPGGFVNHNETLLEAMLRELKEETKLKVPLAVLRNLKFTAETFDAVHRSERGRTITRAFMIELPNGPLPKVKGRQIEHESDGSIGTKRAFWLPLTELDSNNMFEDHFDIIQVMLGRRK